MSACVGVSLVARSPVPCSKNTLRVLLFGGDIHCAMAVVFLDAYLDIFDDYAAPQNPKTGTHHTHHNRNFGTSLCRADKAKRFHQNKL